MGYIGQDKEEERKGISIPAHHMMMAWLYSQRSNFVPQQQDGCVIVDTNGYIVGMGFNKVMRTIELSALYAAFLTRNPHEEVEAVYSVHKPSLDEVLLVQEVNSKVKFYYLIGSIGLNDPAGLLPLPTELIQEVQQYVEFRP